MAKKPTPELTFTAFDAKQESKRPPLERLRELQGIAIRMSQTSEILWAMSLDDLLKTAEQSTQDVMRRIIERRAGATGEGESVHINSGVIEADQDFVLGGLLQVHDTIRNMLLRSYDHEAIFVYRKGVSYNPDVETYQEYHAKESAFTLEYANQQLSYLCPSHEEMYKAVDEIQRAQYHASDEYREYREAMARVGIVLD